MKPDPHRAALPLAERCQWENCSVPRTEMTVYNVASKYLGGPEYVRFGLCDMHIQDTLAAVASNEQHTIATLDTGGRARPGDRAPGSIYYLRTGNLIKIGYTTQLHQRMCQYPPDATLLAVEPGTPKLERARHSLFHAHLARGREWFHPNAELDAWVDQVVDQHGPPPFTTNNLSGNEPERPVVASKRVRRRR